MAITSFFLDESCQQLTANIAEIIGFGQVFGVHIHQGRSGNIGLRASEAEATLAVMLVDKRQGSTTAHYGRHFFGIERFGNSQVFDGQHDDSPKGLVWLGWLVSFRLARRTYCIDRASSNQTPKNDQKGCKAWCFTIKNACLLCIHQKIGC
jgi:hypothetical protein